MRNLLERNLRLKHWACGSPAKPYWQWQEGWWLIVIHSAFRPQRLLEHGSWHSWFMHALSDGHSLFILHSGRTIFSVDVKERNVKKKTHGRLHYIEKENMRKYNSTFITVYEWITDISVRTLTCAAMIFNVTFCICCAWINGTWINATTI